MNPLGRPRRLSAIALALAAFPIGPMVSAQDAAIDVETTDKPDAVSRGRVDDIESTFQRQLHMSQSWRESPLGKLLKPWRDARERFLKRIGLELQLNYDTLYQGYLGGGETKSGAAGEVSLDGRWRLFCGRRGSLTTLDFRLRDRHSYGTRTPSELGDAIGAYWGTVRGFNDSGFAVPDLYFEHEFLDGNLDFRWGQMNFKSLFDGNSLRSAKQAFANRGFSDSPVINFPTYGAGAYFRWLGPKGLELSAGASNIQGTDDTEVVSFDINSSQLFEVGQVAWNFKGFHREDARIQLTFWHSDAIRDQSIPSGNGTSFTYEQAFCDGRLRTFARFGLSNGGSTEIDRMISLGGALKLRRSDYFGLAFVTGQQAETGNRQYVMEGYYRWQLGPEIQLAPSLQILHGKGFYEGNGPHFIFGLRGQVTF